MNDAAQTELATEANFDAARYLAANPDIARHVAAGGDALSHFHDYGQAEGRHQSIAPTPRQFEARDADRYRRFLHVLDPAAGGNGAFRFADRPDAFPLLYGDSSYDLSAYDSESANAGFGPFVVEVRDNPDRLYADIGCGRRPSKADNCLYVEVYPSESADLIVEPGSRNPIA